MKAAVYYENGDPGACSNTRMFPIPYCHPKGIVIRVEAVSIEGGDTLNRWRGALITQAAHRRLPGRRRDRRGRRGSDRPQGRPEGRHRLRRLRLARRALRAVPARNAWLVPEGFDVKLASVIPVPFGTADDCLFEFGHLKAGQTVLVQAGASGVGIAAIQLAKRAGATVLATASSDERLEKLKPLGMDHGINYRTDDVVKSVMQSTDKQGRRPGS